MSFTFFEPEIRNVKLEAIERDVLNRLTPRTISDETQAARIEELEKGLNDAETAKTNTEAKMAKLEENLKKAEAAKKQAEAATTNSQEMSAKNREQKGELEKLNNELITANESLATQKDMYVQQINQLNHESNEKLEETRKDIQKGLALKFQGAAPEIETWFSKDFFGDLDNFLTSEGLNNISEPQRTKYIQNLDYALTGKGTRNVNI